MVLSWDDFVPFLSMIPSLHLSGQERKGPRKWFTRWHVLLRVGGIVTKGTPATVQAMLWGCWLSSVTETQLSLSGLPSPVDPDLIGASLASGA